MGNEFEGFVMPQAKMLPVFLLLDVSGSMALDNKMYELNKSVREMLETFKKEQAVQAEIFVSIITFGDDADLISELDTDGAGADGFSTLGYGLLGFHAVEYVIFRDGQPRNVSEITKNELIFNAAVAEDLAWQTIRLEASWAGVENVDAKKQKILKEQELEPGTNYGEMMILAGESGNTNYKTQIAAMVQILQGASDISDEVGNTKITDPVHSGNVLDVESWYSWNSIEDFTDNLRSVRNVYYGSLDGTVNANSLASYMKKKNADADTKVRTAIDNAIKEVSSMPAPFRNHLTAAETQKAVEACNELMNALDNAITEISK